MIIVELMIKNFKVFESLHLHINGSQLTVLDGPNGFGKTSFFDALELLFTGRVRRYQDIEDIIIDRRSLTHGCSLLHSEAKADDWLSIRAKIQSGENTLFLERAAPKVDLDKAKGLSDAKFDLYFLENLESERGSPVRDEIKFMTDLLGENYRRNFELFHYIEQEENTAILKQKGSQRQDQIAYLFDIESVQRKSHKIKDLENKVGKLCDVTQAKQLKELLDKLNEAKELLQPKATRTPYFKLIGVSNNAWDEKDCAHPPAQYDRWLSDKGILAGILKLVSNRQDFENLLFNKNLKKQLIRSRAELDNFLKFSHRMQSYEEFKLDVQRYYLARHLILELFSDLTTSIKNDSLKLPLDILPILPEDLSITEFEKHIAIIKQLLLHSDQYQSSLAQLYNSREVYLRNFKDYQDQAALTANCPTCGHDWESNSALLKSIELQTNAIRSMISQTDSTVSAEFDYLKKNFIDKIESSLVDFIDNSKETLEYKEKMSRLTNGELELFGVLKVRLDKHGVFYHDLLLSDYNVNSSSDVNKYMERVSLLQKPVAPENMDSNLESVYAEVFNNDIEELRKVTPELVKEKIQYLRLLRSESASLLVSERTAIYNSKKLRIDQSKELKDKLKKLRNIYEEEIKIYLDKVVKEIEIHFHLYSGRLMQNNQQGLGVFIDNNGKSIYFRETPSQIHDVLFSMSSGQLAALVLSFKLALHKRYAKNSLLLIDDPVQTLDEINVAGFIDLLRTDFYNNQIVISTHEERMSTYFRYKFEKYGYTSSRINFMDESKVKWQ